MKVNAQIMKLMLRNIVIANNILILLIMGYIIKPK